MFQQLRNMLYNLNKSFSFAQTKVERLKKTKKKSYKYIVLEQKAFICINMPIFLFYVGT